jgi:hypothetical protein
MSIRNPARVGPDLELALLARGKTTLLRLLFLLLKPMRAGR